MALIKEKIKSCGVELMAWGQAKANPNANAIKKLQQQLDALNEAKTIEGNRAQYLEVCKRMDDLLLKQEIYWAQRSRIPWLKYGDKNTNFFIPKQAKGGGETT